jgi:very-short-patch-repair endonuclease
MEMVENAIVKFLPWVAISHRTAISINSGKLNSFLYRSNHISYKYSLEEAYDNYSAKSRETFYIARCDCRDCERYTIKLEQAQGIWDELLVSLKKTCGDNFEFAHITIADFVCDDIRVICKKHGRFGMDGKRYSPPRVRASDLWATYLNKKRYEYIQPNCEECEKDRKKEIEEAEKIKKDENTKLRRECLSMLKEQYSGKLKFHRVSRAAGLFCKTRKYEVQCVEHGYFDTTISKLINGVGCKQCSGITVKQKSTGESVTKRILEREGIKFETQWAVDLSRFSGDYSRGFFDFKVGKFLIEVDGEQHDFPVTFGGDAQAAIENYRRGAERDVIKNMFAEAEGMTVLRIRRLEWSLSKGARTWEQYVDEKLMGFIEKHAMV